MTGSAKVHLEPAERRALPGNVLDHLKPPVDCPPDCQDGRVGLQARPTDVQPGDVPFAHRRALEPRVAAPE